MTTPANPAVGRELDALVAEMMGWTHDRKYAHKALNHQTGQWEWVTGWRRGDEEHLHDSPPEHYSTTPEGLGVLIDWMAGQGWHVWFYVAPGDCLAHFFRPGQTTPAPGGVGASMPEAGARAALAAQQGEASGG